MLMSVLTTQLRLDEITRVSFNLTKVMSSNIALEMQCESKLKHAATWRIPG